MTKKERASWLRPYFVSPGAPNLHWFLVYGDFPANFQLPIARSDCPRPRDLHPRLVTENDPELDGWRRESFLTKSLRTHPDGIVDDVLHARAGVWLRRECPDVDDLLDLRSSISVVTSAFGWGGVAAIDPLAGRWWSRKDWVRAFVDEALFRPFDHVTIFDSKGWLHTRGMRKFGRADVSLQLSSPERKEAGVDLVGRLIEFQARGGLVDPQRRFDAEGVPPVHLEVHADDEAYDDPDFNNQWIDVQGFR